MILFLQIIFLSFLLATSPKTNLAPTIPSLAATSLFMIELDDEPELWATDGVAVLAAGAAAVYCAAGAEYPKFKKGY